MVLLLWNDRTRHATDQFWCMTSVGMPVVCSGKTHHNEVLRRRKFSLPNFSKTFSTTSRCTFLEFERKPGQVPRIFLHDRGIKIQNYRHTQTNPNLRKTTVVSGMPEALEWRGGRFSHSCHQTVCLLASCWLVNDRRKPVWMDLSCVVQRRTALVPRTCYDEEDRGSFD